MNTTGAGAVHRIMENPDNPTTFAQQLAIMARWFEAEGDDEGAGLAGELIARLQRHHGAAVEVSE